MAKRKTPIAILLGIVLGFIPSVMYAYGGYEAGGWKQGLSAWVNSMTGYNPQSFDQGFNSKYLRYGLYPAITGTAVGVIVHKYGGKHINQYLPKGVNI